MLTLLLEVQLFERLHRVDLGYVCNILFCVVWLQFLPPPQEDVVCESGNTRSWDCGTIDVENEAKVY